MSDHRALLSQQALGFQSPALRQITLEVQAVGGINLGQGVSQLPVPEFVLEAADQAAKAGINRYTNPRGLESLRVALANKLAHFNKIDYLDPEREILVTCGATGAFEGVCASLLNPGDEVVIFEPYYPYHVQALKRYGAVIRFVMLRGRDFEVDWEGLEAAVNDKTKFVLVNTPGNPSGKVFNQGELKRIGEILERFPALIVTDEIYEYMAFDGFAHLSPASLPELRERTITIGGYSKTFSITGWRIGYAVAPAEIAEPIASVLDAVYVCAPAPLQEAVAQGIVRFDDAFYRDLNAKYERKRNMFVDGLRAIGMEPFVPEGAYYLLSRYDAIAPGMGSMEFVRHMIASTGVGAVPSSDFVRHPATAPWVRFCLALEDDRLERALERLGSLRPAVV
ncbi:MAG: pyridoxal phosphate-dependent aminotransferase [Armatimonadetes bacterium]|nr:pyridoxal phosphate-dependent aminotransferase [Armatimonadota bacterium]